MDEVEDHISRSEKVLSASNYKGEVEIEDGEMVSYFSIEIEGLPEWLDTKEPLPKGYGFSGGVARGVLLNLLQKKTPRPADMDVVSIEDHAPDLSLIKEVSEKYMTKDNLHGYGVQLYSSMEEYLSSRDFTINEVIFIDNKLYFTERACRDLDKKVIRPTEYENGSWKSYHHQREGISPKLALKALILQCEFMRMYGQGDIQGISHWQWDIEGIPPFNLALALEKAHNKRVAIPFYVQLLNLGNIMDDNLPPGRSKENVLRLAHWVRRGMLLKGQKPFDFSDSDLNVDPALDLKIQEEWEKYYDMANSFSGNIRGLASRERKPRY